MIKDNQLKNKVLNIIIQNKILQPNDKVLIAVSGGADSTALLHVFNDIKKELNIELYAAHFNHGFRGKESDADAEFVKKLCVKMEIPCTIIKKNIPQLLKKNKKLSPQDFSRKLRYEFLATTAKKNACKVIATGHNIHDQTETILLHLFRGSGLTGLIGMQLQKEIIPGIYLIRPFLFITRKEIEDYLNKNSIKFREDSSNLSDKYLRNHLRHHFIPEILKYYNQNLDNSLMNLSEILSDDNDFLNKIVHEKYNEIVTKKNNVFSVDIDILKKQHISIVKRLFRKLLSNLNDISYEHIKSILNLMNNSTGRMIDLPGNYIIKNEYGKLIFMEKQNKTCHYEYKISVPSVNDFIDLNMKITAKLCKKKFVKDEKNKIYLNFNEIPVSFILRNRRDGDRFIPFGMDGTKKIKNFFIDLKIPKEKRDQIPLLLYENEIVWVIGYRKSNKFRIGDKGKYIVEIIIESNTL